MLRDLAAIYWTASRDARNHEPAVVARGIETLMRMSLDREIPQELRQKAQHVLSEVHHLRLVPPLAVISGGKDGSEASWPAPA